MFFFCLGYPSQKLRSESPLNMTSKPFLSTSIGIVAVFVEWFKWSNLQSKILINQWFIPITTYIYLFMVVILKCINHKSFDFIINRRFPVIICFIGFLKVYLFRTFWYPTLIFYTAPNVNLEVRRYFDGFCAVMRIVKAFLFMIICEQIWSNTTWSSRGFFPLDDCRRNFSRSLNSWIKS